MGFFGSLWKKIKHTVGKAHKWAKKTKILSTALGMVKGMDPRLAMAHSAAKKFGYGRRMHRRIGRGRRGTNSLTQIDRRVAYTTFPTRIPKLSVQLHKIDNSLGLAGNYR
jgi:hypothetical protein